jgi:hypothetical protein
MRLLPLIAFALLASSCKHRTLKEATVELAKHTGKPIPCMAAPVQVSCGPAGVCVGQTIERNCQVPAEDHCGKLDLPAMCVRPSLTLPSDEVRSLFGCGG